MEVPSIKQEELERVAEIYESIRELYRAKNPEADDVLAEALENHIREAMSELYERLSEDVPNSILHAYVNKTRNQLFQLCAEKLVGYIEWLEAPVGKLLAEVLGEQMDLFTDTNDKLLNSLNEIEAINNSVEDGKRETEQILHAAEDLEKQVQALTDERDSLKEQLMKAKDENSSQMLQLQEENRSYLEKIIKMSKQLSSKPAENSVINPPQPSPTKKETVKEKETKPYFSIKPFSVNIPATVRELTLKQMKDFMEELYANKAKFDQKCYEVHQPRETLSQYLQTFLNHKYGLKSLRQEWNQAILKAIDKYSSEDSEVSLFSKVMKNEIEEEFRFTFKQLKSSISDVLKHILKLKFPYMQEKAVKDLVSEKVSSELEESEWTGILDYMYNPDDKLFLYEVLQELLRHKSLSSRISSRRMNRGEVPKDKVLLPFNDLLRILSEFQLESHEKLLAPFQAKFREVDQNGDGVLDESEFRVLLDSLNMGGEAERMLEIVDPYEINSITFSDIIALLSNVTYIQEQDSGVSYLQKIYSEFATHEN
jgi:Ca2+-binding EF-hand superfamily protein